MRGSVVMFAVAIMTLGLVGFGSCAYRLTRYAHAKLGVHNERRRNRDLVRTIRFMERLGGIREQEVAELAAFEDKARLKFGLNRISEDVRQAGVGGLPNSDDVLLNSLEDLVVQKAARAAEALDAILRRVALQDSTFSRMARHVERQHDRWSQRPAVWPTPGRRVTSGYGYRPHPFLGRTVFHEGLDIADKMWTPVFATADGFVSFVGTKGDFGTAVSLSHHGGEYTTVYAHLVKAARVEGEVVKRGEVIGYLGDTGRSTGPHLHYEVRRFGQHVNPVQFILPVDTVVD